MLVHMTKKLCVRSTSVGSDISCFHSKQSDLGLLCSVCKSVKRHLNEVIHTLIKRSDALFWHRKQKSPIHYIIHPIVLKFVGNNGFIFFNSQPRGMRVTDSYSRL